MKKAVVAAAGALLGMTLIAQTAFGASYTVQAGDSVWKIATKHGLSTGQLVEMNGLASDMIMPGQVLKVPGPETYSVKKGETLWIITQKLGITLEALLEANPGVQPTNIYEGLTLQLPEGVEVSKELLAPAKPAEYLNGVFPVAKGQYQPMINTYADARTWTPNGPAVRTHEGVDIMAAEGVPVYNAVEGTVINYGWNQMGGWRLTVRVDDSTAFYYAHLSGYAPGIGPGVKVQAGQLIGYVGDTGYGPVGTKGKFDPHLHFGIYKTNGKWQSMDPFEYLKWWEFNNAKP
ncbi:M23 family metallopeptidase [Paenibacillus turpanensis]|uniref:M23 family metallopeptidase n=1 Tax=Paenibacillus turpanensis TaxID=2689078 RepID=UPI001408E30D|nr:M23 family metallopeptidase [Paenibacillus turpanensis]